MRMEEKVLFIFLSRNETWKKIFSRERWSGLEKRKNGNFPLFQFFFSIPMQGWSDYGVDGDDDDDGGISTFSIISV